MNQQQNIYVFGQRWLWLWLCHNPGGVTWLSVRSLTIRKPKHQWVTLKHKRELEQAAGQMSSMEASRADSLHSANLTWERRLIRSRALSRSGSTGRLLVICYLLPYFHKDAHRQTHTVRDYGGSAVQKVSLCSKEKWKQQTPQSQVKSCFLQGTIAF